MVRAVSSQASLCVACDFQTFSREISCDCRCKAFAPEWELAVEKLAALEPPIQAGRMDAENNEQIAGRYNITMYCDLHKTRPAFF